MPSDKPPGRGLVASRTSSAFLMKNFLLILALLFPLLVRAQPFTVKGVVRAKANRAALPGVTVLEKGTSNGVSTDREGRFTLVTTGPAPQLVFASIGYASQVVAITKSDDALVVLLQEDVKSLSEVVMTGMGAPRRRSMSGAVSSVSGSLAGRVPGLMIRGARGISDAPSLYETAPAKGAVAGATGVAGVTGARAGILTAGELNDFGKWTLWSDIAQKDLSEWRQLWQISPLERYSAQLVTEEGFPVIGATVLLLDNQDSPIWRAQTDNTGKCELWNGLFTADKAQRVASLRTVVDGKTYSIRQPTVFHNGINIVRVKYPCQAAAVIDIAFVVDATGSMSDEIQYLQAELGDVMAKVQASQKSTTINLGSVFYRDAGDEYVTRQSPFSPNIEQTTHFISQQRADGGGDTPEAVDKALAAALNDLTWSANAKARLLFLILDAPPHENPEALASLQHSIRQAAAAGIRIIPITASGLDKSTEYLMRAMALATNGTYVFLTDDSGVGDAHIKPTTDKFDVELLNTLLVKLVVKYAYTTDCQSPTASLVSKGGLPTGLNSAVADTSSQKAHPARPAKAYSWSCYPNPTSDVLNVELESEMKELFVTDVTGKIMLRATPDHNKATLQLGSFPTGVYFVQFFTGKKWEKSRFLVIR